MAKYDVYGMGNALVDMEFLVDDEFLKSMDIKKGLMMLVDEERQNKLLTHLTHGEMKVKRACGGSAANTCIAVGQFGGKSFYSCKVSNDESGKFYLQDLQDSGVDTMANLQNGQGSQSSLPTGKCFVFVTPDTERSMETFLGVTATYSPQEIDEEAIKNSQYLYIEGYLISGKESFAAMKKAKEMAQSHGVKVALTLSDPFMVNNFKKEFLELIGSGVDLIFANEHEALSMTENGNSGDFEKAKECFKELTKNYVITLHDKGAVAWDGNTMHSIAPNKVTAVDSNGAGDMFAGAFLYSITQGKSFAEAGKLASLAASQVVTQYGPRLKKEASLALRDQVF